MLRSLAATAALAVGVTGLATTPAVASTSEVFYGFAWADGADTLRITPAEATLVKGGGVLRYKLTPVPGAKERRLNYSGVDFRRITAECGLKETEGVVKLDGKGLGRTRCQDRDLTFALRLDPVPIRVSLGTTKRIHEILATPSDSKTAYGTIKRQNDTTVVFTKGGRSVKLGYTDLVFNRVTGKCGDAWLSGHVNARRDGLGTKVCTTPAFTKVMKGVRHPVLAKVDYNPRTGQLLQVWEVFGDA
ncbi:hypothetical protein FHR32_002140 [Streptosporangium album]|uniref:DUF3108 domain-containing protein n=1 Tax=Streptosporangium album TaxID=47479 RepID=A0A7W7RTB6_9ACTN|nr:hypothetical protein [Streptosporangium album]MBB4937835.1 hypothetical protein [Streptosporangium album]